jgi:hypothetical protein
MIINVSAHAEPHEQINVAQWMAQQLYPSGAPYFLGFDREQVMNITTLVGGTTLLPCRVRFLGNRTVRFARFLESLTIGKIDIARNFNQSLAIYSRS